MNKSYNKQNLNEIFNNTKWKGGLSVPQIKNFLDRIFSVFKSLPFSIFCGLGIASLFIFGAFNTALMLVMNFFFTGLPIIIFVRWMMKRQSNNQNF